MSGVALLKDWHPRHDEGEVTCAWCHRTATGWSQLDGDTEHWYPSCGSYPDRHTKLHGRRFTTNTTRICVECGKILSGDRRRDAVFCDSTCKSKARSNPFQIRVLEENEMTLIAKAERKRAIAGRAQRKYLTLGRVSERMGYPGGELDADVSSVS